MNICRDEISRACEGGEVEEEEKWEEKGRNRGRRDRRGKGARMRKGRDGGG